MTPLGLALLIAIVVIAGIVVWILDQMDPFN